MPTIRRDSRLPVTTKNPTQTTGSTAARSPFLIVTTKNRPPTEGAFADAPKKSLVTLTPPGGNPAAPTGTPSFKVVGGELRPAPNVTISPIERGGQTIGDTLVRTIMPVRGGAADLKKKLA